MLSSNPICPVCNYATSAVYCDLPAPEQLVNGVKPLDSLPAAWWNKMWNMINCSVNQARGAVGSFITELNNVLAGAGICPNCVCTDQLYQAIDRIRQTIGNATVAGAVKSSSTPGMVSIDENGFMTANCVGNATQLATSARTLVGAVNELKTTYDTCFGSVSTALGGKAPTSHASSATTYGVGTSANYGHLRISGTYTSDLKDAGMAASQSALYSVYNYATQISVAAIGLGNVAGCPLGTASAGTAGTAARSDHVHPLQACIPPTGFGVTAFTYLQTEDSFAGSPEEWAHYLISNHGDGSTYFNYIIREPFFGPPQYSRMIQGCQSPWRDFITSENITSQSVACATCAANATNATNATCATCAVNATCAVSAEWATCTHGVIDYCNSTAPIRIAYAGPSLTKGQVSYLAAFSTNFASGQTIIKDAALDAVQSWLGLGSAAYRDASDFRPSTWIPGLVCQACGLLELPGIGCDSCTLWAMHNIWNYCQDCRNYLISYPSSDPSGNSLQQTRVDYATCAGRIASFGNVTATTNPAMRTWSVYALCTPTVSLVPECDIVKAIYQATDNLSQGRHMTVSGYMGACTIICEIQKVTTDRIDVCLRRDDSTVGWCWLYATCTRSWRLPLSFGGSY